MDPSAPQSGSDSDAPAMRATGGRARLEKSQSEATRRPGGSRASSPRASAPSIQTGVASTAGTTTTATASGKNTPVGKPSLHPNARPTPVLTMPAAGGGGAASAGGVPGTVKLLSELERSWAMFAASWKVVDLFAGMQIWQEQRGEAQPEPLNSVLVSTSSAGLVTFLAGSIGGGGVGVALLLTLAVVAAAVWTLSAARATRPVPCFKTLRAIDGAPSELFLFLMNVRNLPIWDASVERAQVVHTIDDHSDIIHVVYRPVWVWPLWIAPRDLCLLRYWRRAEDGSYVICLQSAIHPECPPTHGLVRAQSNGGGYIIAPRGLGTSASSDELSSMVTSVVHMDPQGWEGKVLRRFNALQTYLRPQILALTGLQEVMEARKYVCPNVPEEFAAAVEELSASAAAGMTAAGEAEPGADGAGASGAGGVALKELPTNVPRAMWCEPEGGSMLVRGPDYLSDRRKIPSAPPAFRLVGVDLFQSNVTLEHIASRPDNIIQKELKRHEAEGTEMPFTFVMNFVVPGSPRISLALYYQAPSPSVLADGSPFAELMNDFLEGTDEFRNERFKLIPCIVEGPFIVRQAVGTTPAIIGKKLRQPYFSGKRYFELDVDIGSSAVANRVVGLVSGYTKKLVIDMGFLIEGQRADELPERLFGTARLVHIDLGVAVKLE